MVGYKWLHIFDNNWLVGLKGKERSGRPPDVPKETRIEIRQELADSNAGWDFIQVMNLIYDKIGVRFHKYISTVCYTTGDSNLRYKRKDL